MTLSVLKRFYDGKKLGVSYRITGFYWYYKSTKASGLEGLYSINQNLEEQLISNSVKINSFGACVESTLQYNAVAWA
jgi:hypothetical protein